MDRVLLILRHPFVQLPCKINIAVILLLRNWDLVSELEAYMCLVSLGLGISL
jgi:hypothetical protein